MQHTTHNKQQSSLIHHFLEQSARTFPDKIALVHEDIRATYFEINNKANHLAHWLLGRGITKGDRVVLLLENSIEYVISYYGALKTGAVVASLNSDLKPDGLRSIIRDLEPGIIISSRKFERNLKAVDLNSFHPKALILDKPVLKWSSDSFPIFLWEDIPRGSEASDPGIQMDKSDLSSIVYTSGSTGTPKGVMLSHGNIVSNTRSICRYLNLTGKDIQMVVLPFFYVMGKSLLNTHFAVGGQVVINNKFAFPATVINQMVDEQVTGFSGVPSTYAYLLHRSPLKSCRERLGSLRYCSQAGGHMSLRIKKELRRVLPAHTEIFIMYGATEASARLSFLSPDRFEDKMGSIGKAISGVVLRILDENGRELPNNQTGELVAAGSNIMRGYWKDEQATAGVLDPNGYHTGDLGYRDDEGYFYLTGRKDNVLKVGGHRINPGEIEDALMDSDLVIETAVIGIPDDLLGNKLIAFAAPKNGDCSENRILRFCAGRLPKHKIPSDIKLVRALPKSSSGKINRTQCLELLKMK